MKSKAKRTIEIFKYGSGEVVKTIDVTGRSERTIDKICAGMAINLNHDEYGIRENSPEFMAELQKERDP